MKALRQVSVRELQHNLSNYLELAKTTPLSITKYGKDEVVVVNPRNYNFIPKKSLNIEKKDIMQMAFLGMHKNKLIKKSNLEIAKNLRQKAWYGK